MRSRILVVFIIHCSVLKLSDTQNLRINTSCKIPCKRTSCDHKNREKNKDLYKETLCSYVNIKQPKIDNEDVSILDRKNFSNNLKSRCHEEFKNSKENIKQLKTNDDCLIEENLFIDQNLIIEENILNNDDLFIDNNLLLDCTNSEILDPLLKKVETENCSSQQCFNSINSCDTDLYTEATIIDNKKSDSNQPVCIAIEGIVYVKGELYIGNGNPIQGEGWIKGIVRMNSEISMKEVNSGNAISVYVQGSGYIRMEANEKKLIPITGEGWIEVGEKFEDEWIQGKGSIKGKTIMQEVVNLTGVYTGCCIDNDIINQFTSSSYKVSSTERGDENCKFKHKKSKVTIYENCSNYKSFRKLKSQVKNKSKVKGKKKKEIRGNITCDISLEDIFFKSKNKNYQDKISEVYKKEIVNLGIYLDEIEKKYMEKINFFKKEKTMEISDVKNVFGDFLSLFLSIFYNNVGKENISLRQKEVKFIFTLMPDIYFYLKDLLKVYNTKSYETVPYEILQEENGALLEEFNKNRKNMIETEDYNNEKLQEIYYKKLDEIVQKFPEFCKNLKKIISNFYKDLGSEDIALKLKKASAKAKAQTNKRMKNSTRLNINNEVLKNICFIIWKNHREVFLELRKYLTAIY